MAEVIPRIHRRRPYGRTLSGKVLSGYQESDLDYVMNNLGAAVALLDREVRTQKRARTKKGERT